jgi:hypothetical protein
MIETPVQAAAGASLRERAIAAAVARERRDREQAADRQAAIQRETIKAATSTAADIFGELASGVGWLYIPATVGPPGSVDRALATIDGGKVRVRVPLPPPAPGAVAPGRVPVA